MFRVLQFCVFRIEWVYCSYQPKTRKKFNFSPLKGMSCMETLLFPECGFGSVPHCDTHAHSEPKHYSAQACLCSQEHHLVLNLVKLFWCFQFWSSRAGSAQTYRMTLGFLCFVCTVSLSVFNSNMFVLQNFQTLLPNHPAVLIPAEFLFLSFFCFFSFYAIPHY